jgi:hypothetical protein
MIAAQWPARARWITHLCDFWGDPSDEFSPSPGFALPHRPEFLVLEFAPRAGREHFTYATAGLSFVPQAARGPMPFVELIACAARRDLRVAEFLFMLAHDIAHARVDEASFKAFDLWGAERHGLRDFVLAPAREPEALLDFPNREKRKEDERYLLATTGALDGAMKLHLLELVPLTTAEWREATEQGSRALLARLGWETLPRTYGWP